MDDICIRKATLSDLDNLVHFENDCFTSDRMSRQSYRALLKKNTAEILIVEIEKKLIGAATLFYRKNSDNARLYSFGIHANHRERGIAASLRETIEKNAKLHGCNTILLEVRTDNTKAIHFYKKRGYETFGTFHHYYEDGTDALRMNENI